MVNLGAYNSSTICLHMNKNTHVAYNFDHLFEDEVIIKVTVGHVHCKCGNMSEMMQDGVVVTTDH